MQQIEFQVKAIEELLSQFKKLWRQPQYQIPITLKAPTGSGKTYMTQKFICELFNQPDWEQDVAFVWITFSDDLAMQSRDKFYEYFPTTLPGRLLTINDLQNGVLASRDIMFLNWQKLVSKKAEGRVNRRPNDPRLERESGFYFEDVADNTHAEGRTIILIIDESHKNVTSASMRDVINPLNPKIILKVSATPEEEPNYSDVKNLRAGFVEVLHEDVVAADMIKHQIVCQTEDDLRRFAGEDLDKALLQSAMKRRQQLCDEIANFGMKVNPLVIIQLPNDDQNSIDAGIQTKEQYVTSYLLSQGVPEERIAKWFTNEKKPKDLEDNDSPYDYLLFKTAAGTGWDCPRAQVLVMFREIQSETFHTQTIGRIVRIPIRNVQGTQVFRTGYIYTNYSRNAVINGDYKEKSNKPKLFIAENIKGSDVLIDEKLHTEYIHRADYGDLGKSYEFQTCLKETFDKGFGIDENDIMDVLRDKLKSKGLTLEGKLTQEIFVNAKFEDADNIGLELMNGMDATYEVSKNDVQKLFTLQCVRLLREQTDEDCKVGNIARSWGALKSALRCWFRSSAFPGMDDDTAYRIFLNDVLKKKESSIFRSLITQTLKNYRPKLNEQITKRKEIANKQSSKTFVIQKAYAYTEDYEAIEMNRCLLKPFYIRKEYNGRDTELPFANYLDSQESIEWWFKNGDSGKDWFSIRYYNELTQKEELFYPDWIFKKKDGTIGIFDTKGGLTASAIETKNKAERLQKHIQTLNGYNRENIRFVGGIVVKANGQWYFNNDSVYVYRPNNTDGWINMNELLQ